MTGVAQAANSIDDLASFLGGEPEEARKDEEDAERQPEQDGNEEEPDEPESEEDPDETPDDQAGRKIKVPVKGEDGQEGFEEIEEKELIAGYERQKAFTQKTMALADRERQATEIVQQRVTEASQYALQQAQAAKAVVVQLAGLQSEEDMQRMAVEDPAGWVQEQARLRYVNGLIDQLDNAAKVEQSRIDQMQKAQEQERSTAAWKVLTEKGIDRQKLSALYDTVMKDYGVTSDQLGKVLEPGLVLALKDAAAYRALQAKKPEVAQKVKDAERLPTSKKSAPPTERVNRALGEKFSRGKAKVNDLAAFLENNRF